MWHTLLMARDPAWELLDVGTPLRVYQRRAVDELTASLEGDCDRICLIAPPGAGKTRCALHVASKLERTVDVRVPTTALVQQWQQRIAEEVVAVGQEAARPFRVSTYAAKCALPPDALVILDEAHHLGAAWGRELLDQLTPENRLLGLTATPPEGSDGWDQFLRLVGAHPVEVPAPPLVRDGHLSPFIDLVWPVIAEMDDLDGLREADQALREVERTHEQELGLHTERRLREDLWELTEDRFARRKGLLVALCRVRHTWGRTMPADLLVDDELTARPTLHDRVQVLWDFGADRDDVRKAIRAAGFRRAGSGLVLAVDVAYRNLAASASRLAGMVEILAMEARTRTDWMRALILTDRDIEGGKLSAREVLRALVSHPETDALDPILVTGKAFWVDDDLWPRIAPQLPDLRYRDVGDHKEVDISHWPVAERVAVVTGLLTRGVTRCLVGTRHLLGEGWDCPAVNCVVDLTGIAAPVTVNQVRGRALRQDPADPGKVASLWEVIAVAPGIDGGDRMLQTLRARHANTLGIDDEGRIRAGVGRIDPRLAGTADQVAADTAAIREAMCHRVETMHDARAAWAVGQEYIDRRVWRVSGRAKLPRAAQVTEDAPDVPMIDPQRAAEALPSSLVVRRQVRVAKARRRGWYELAALGGLGSSAAVTVAAAAAAPFVLPAGRIATGVGGLALAALFMAAGGGVGASALLRRRRPAPDPEAEHIDAAIQALDDALRRKGQLHGVLRREGDDAWIEGDPEESRLFAVAAAELLGPVRYPRYLLIEPDSRIWPVPATLGADRSSADRFARCWAAHVGTGEVLYARGERGKELLRRAWRAGGRAGVDVLELWE